MADKKRLVMAKSKRKSQKLERRREDPPMPQLSELTTLPKKVPIDWFDPTYWNNTLTVRERADYIAKGIFIALPLPEFCETWEQCAKWKNLSEADFMLTYGNAVLDKYNIPTDEELEHLTATMGIRQMRGAGAVVKITQLTTHLTHLPSSACAPAAPPPPAPTTSTSTNTFTPPPLPKGEILTGISNILCSPSSPGIIGEHDVYRVRPKGLDLYGPYYDQEELEFDLLGGRAVSSNSSKTKKGKGKGDENEEKLEKDLTTPSAPPRRGRERAPTQSFDRHGFRWRMARRRRRR
ncbi:hypothetical protein FPV67DRAFT_1703383 [Lyophyllum atratum]|nr:hypothetical protein FPV67DRAFT_1703383 [Lyophyllum atratum]